MVQFFPSIDSTYSGSAPLSAKELRAISSIPTVRELDDVLGAQDIVGLDHTSGFGRDYTLSTGNSN